jgi:hypothetical protein
MVFLFHLKAVELGLELQPFLIALPNHFTETDGILKRHGIDRGGHLMERERQA